MKKSLNTTVLLSLVLIGLIAWYTLYEKKYKGKLNEKEENAKKLISLTSDEVQELTILRLKNPPPEGQEVKNPEYEKIRLTKAGTEWQLNEPVKDQADTSNVTSALSTLTSSKEERVVDENPKDLAPYGLKDPIAKVTLKHDSKSEELWIGTNTPVGFSSYAKVASRPQVYRISRSVRTNFEKEASQYRNKTLVPVKREEIGELEIQLSKENIILKKGEKDSWTLARENIPADGNEVSKTIAALIDLKAHTIVSDSPSGLSEYGLTQPLIKATLQREKEKTRFQVIIGKGTNKNKDKYFARREDRLTVYEVTKASIESLERHAQQYRDLKVAGFNRFNVKEIKWEKGEGSFDLHKTDTTWQFTGDNTTKIDSAQVDTFLTKLQDSKLTRYLTQKSHPSLKDPKLVLRLIEKKDDKEIESVLLTFGVPSNKEVIVKRKDSELLFAIKEEDYLKLNVPKTSFVQQEKKAETPGAPGEPKTPELAAPNHPEKKSE